MKYSAYIASAIVLLSVAAFAVSKDFNGRMWLAQVPGLPSDGNTAYSQWTDDGKGQLKPGEGFQSVTDGINSAVRDQAQADMPSQSQQQQQMATAQQMAAKYGTPEGQAALKNMTPDQLMALARQMSPQGGAHIVSPDDQVQLQKINNGVYSGHQQVMDDMLSIEKQVNAIEAQWTAAEGALVTQEAAAEKQLPVCKGEAGIPSDQSVRDLKLQYADKRIALAGQYLPKFTPLVDKLRVTLQPEIDFGDDAIAALSKIQDPTMKQQVSASANGAEQQGLSDVAMIEQLISRLSLKAAQTVADKKSIERRYADAKGCQ